MSTRKRKPASGYSDEAPMKRAKSTSETPTKRKLAPRKPKGKPNHVEEDIEDVETATERTNSTSLTPAKRTPVPRKRKANPKYNDDDEEDEEDNELFVEHAKAIKKTPAQRTPAARSVKTKRDDPDWLVTNEKSLLAYEDLHAELSDPRTYEGFTKEDWEDLRSTLPDNVPLDPDGYSISTEFLKYDRDFRRGIREFQEDLSTGRLDPKWQAAAAEAMEERARGDFDDFKEKNYEEFWGQKQKLAYDALAGESTNLKLETMVENGMFKVGDEFVFSRVIGRKEKRVLIEKELKVIAVGDNTLTFAIPPGQLKFSRPHTAPQPLVDAKLDEAASTESEIQPVNEDVSMVNGVKPADATINDQRLEDKATMDGDHGGGGAKASAQHHEALDWEQRQEVRPWSEGMDAGTNGTEAQTAGIEGNEAKVHDRIQDTELQAGVVKDDMPDNSEPSASKLLHVPASIDADSHISEDRVETTTHGFGHQLDIPKPDTNPRNLESGVGIPNSTDSHDGVSPPAIDNNTHNRSLSMTIIPPEPPDADIYVEIKNLKQLMDKAIEIDGRLNPKDIKAVPASNPWKLMRVKRNNQDLGTLFEMRDEFYAYKLPKLDKKTKK